MVNGQHVIGPKTIREWIGANKQTSKQIKKLESDNGTDKMVNLNLLNDLVAL